MLKRCSITVMILLSFCATVWGQTGGNNTYEFLNLTHSGLVSSLGGSNVSLNNGNINLAYHNPALLTSEMRDNAALDYVNYFAGVNYGLALYSWQVSGNGNMAGGVTFYSYGKFTEADQTGVITGEFTASEFSFPVIYSKNIDSLFTIGITFKPVLSHLERYTSFGFAFDFGAGYHNPDGLFSAGLVIRNAGLQLTKYASEERMKLPFGIEAGFSQKLEHAPLRFSLTLTHLEKYNLIYDSAENDENFIIGSRVIDNMMRHVVFGAEFIPGENFYISGGFNYLRRKDLDINTNLSAVGFSWGFGINTSLLNMEFARSVYHIAGTSTHISMIVKLDKLYDK